MFCGEAAINQLEDIQQRLNESRLELNEALFNKPRTISRRDRNNKTNKDNLSSCCCSGGKKNTNQKVINRPAEYYVPESYELFEQDIRRNSMNDNTLSGCCGSDKEYSEESFSSTEESEQEDCCGSNDDELEFSSDYDDAYELIKDQYMNNTSYRQKLRSMDRDRLERLADRLASIAIEPSHNNSINGSQVQAEESQTENKSACLGKCQSGR